MQLQGGTEGIWATCKVPEGGNGRASIRAKESKRVERTTLIRVLRLKRGDGGGAYVTASG